jgi:hypothetical protein
MLSCNLENEKEGKAEMVAKLFESSSDEELNLDLPKRKVTISKRICESSEEENEESVKDLDSGKEDKEFFVSSAVNIGGRRSTKQRPLSKDFIVNSDEDDNPTVDSELSSVEEEAEETQNLTRMEKLKKLMAAKKRNKDKEEHVELAVDFKSTLKIQFSDDEEPVLAPDTQQRSQIPSKVKKPKETLKKVLMESDALLRRDLPINLPVSVAKPQNLQLILNEALAHNSRSPADARKRVVEVKRDLQRKKLEKMLGMERMQRLALDTPKIGLNRLDETVEIDVDVDEKAPLTATDSTRNVVSVKLTNLPNKHLDSTGKNVEQSYKYKSHFPVYRKASIEVLNDQLKDKIAAQSNALLVRHQKAAAAAAQARRVKMEIREKARRAKEVRREGELKAKREQKATGKLFTKEYEDVERPSTQNTRDTEMIVHLHKGPVRIQLSDDESEDEFENDLLNLVSENESEVECENEYDVESDNKNNNESFTDTWDGMLSGGKFDQLEEDEDREEEEEEAVLPSSPIKTTTTNDGPVIKIVKSQKRSEFIDDEASDEDDEMEAEIIDEAALDEEMRKSKFIRDEDDDEEEEEEGFDHRACDIERRRMEDSDGIKRLMGKFAGHLQGERLLDDHDDSLLDSLESKYGLMSGSVVGSGSKSTLSSSRFGKNVSRDEDEEIRLLLDPLEQKKRKLSALGPLNVLNRKSRLHKLFDDQDVEHAGPVEFKGQSEKSSTGSRMSHHHTSHDANFSSDYYASSDNSDFDDDDGSENEKSHGEEEENYYEAVESGIQSRVAEMLDAESLDAEEMQVQASESLQSHLSRINHGKGGDVEKALTKASVIGKSSVVVPSANAQLKNRLLALQHENDENSNEKRTFKGFTTINK